MVELFDKKFVHFMWSDELEGKEGFFAMDIWELTNCISSGNLHYTKVQKSLSPAYPFKDTNNNDWMFFYYDPNYECKRAYLEGKQIEVKNGNSWIDVSGEPTWDLSNIYRIKLESTNELYDSNGRWNDFWNDLVEENKKLRKENEDLEWQLNEIAKDNDYYKGENKRLEEENELLRGRVKELEYQNKRISAECHKLVSTLEKFQKNKEYSKINIQDLLDNSDEYTMQRCYMPKEEDK